MKDKFFLIATFLASISIVSLVGTEKIHNLAQTISSGSYDYSTSSYPTETTTSGTTFSGSGTTYYTYPTVGQISSFNGAPGSCGSGKIVLSWPTVSYAEQYKIYRGDHVVYEGSNIAFTDGGLDVNKIYNYKLIAFNSSSMSSAYTSVVSPPLCTTTSGTEYTATQNTTSDTTATNNESSYTTEPTPTETPTTAPTTLYTISLKAVPGACGTNFIRLSWDTVNEAYYYKVYLGEKLVYGGTNLGFYSSGLEYGKTYTYHVSAHRKDGVLVAKTSLTATSPIPCTTTTATEPYYPPQEPVTQTTSTYETDTVKTEVSESYVKPETTIQNTITETVTAPYYPTQVYGDCDFTEEYLKKSTGTCLPRSYCFLEANPEYKSIECQDVRRYSTQTENNEVQVVDTSVATNIYEVSKTLEESRIAKEKAITDLSRLIEQKITEAFGKIGSPNEIEKRGALETLRNRLITKVQNFSLIETPVTKENIETLTKEVRAGLEEIYQILALRSESAEPDLNLEKIFKEFDETLKNQIQILESSNSDLVFKDSNDDGVSDYDALHIFNLDPEKPMPVSDYEGRKIRADEKLLLGFDPTKEELVKITYEEPVYSPAPLVESYVVKEIKVNEEKKVVMSGEALPNSFVTIYIYSTPIVVTVKTNNNGVWKYTLDKELEDGEHTIYTASVDVSGKIIARSSAVPFVKTAEAAVIGSLPVEIFPEKKPAVNVFVITIAFLSLVFLTILIVGYIESRNKIVDGAEPPNPQT